MKEQKRKVNKKKSIDKVSLDINLRIKGLEKKDNIGALNLQISGKFCFYVKERWYRVGRIVKHKHLAEFLKGSNYHHK